MKAQEFTDLFWGLVVLTIVLLAISGMAGCVYRIWTG